MRSDFACAGVSFSIGYLLTIETEEKGMADQHQSIERPAAMGGSANTGNTSDNAGATGYGVAQATEGIEKLRGMIDQATQSIKELTQMGQQWAQNAPGRAQEVAQQVREQGGKAVGTMSETVEQNPLVSMVVAFAAGFFLASLIKR